MPPPGGNLTQGGLSVNTASNNSGHAPSLLSPVEYDADAISIRSDQDSDSDDDQLQQRARNSRELRAHDRMVFLEEDETEILVTDARREQDRGRRRGSNLALTNPFKFLGIRRYSDGSRSRSPDPTEGARGGAGALNTPRSTITNATTLMASSSTDSLVAGGRDNEKAGGPSSKSERRKQRRQRRKDKKKRLLSQARDGEDAELMFEMEEGGMKEGSSTGDSSDRDDRTDSDEVDRRGLAGLADLKGRRKRRSWAGWLLLHSLIAVLFALLVLGAWKMTLMKKAQHQQQQEEQAHKGGSAKAKTIVSNGTALFAPTTLIISLDGFRADFLNRGLTPRLNAFIREGVSPLYMMPSFPSVTFPNHYTLATGLYPECHGIVGNTFWDPALKADFHYTDPARSLDPKWWGGEPLWVTAERQGARTAIHMWPGSEAHILGEEPSYVDKYNGKEKLSRKVSRILEFLDQPGLESAAADDIDGSRVPNLRPQLIAAYVPNVDADGHRYGPNSTEIRGTIAAVDSMLNDIFLGLEARNLTQIVNVVVVSDHGMATTDVSRLMQLEDLVDMDKIQHVDGWPLVGLRPKDDNKLESIYQSVLNRTADNPNLEVYLRDVNMPERYHFSHNPRIAPLWLVPKTGWNIVQRDEFDVAEGKANSLVYHPRGLHGYDHEHPLMRAIFVARGPAFPHAPNSKLEAFQNIEVYNMICDSIGIDPKPNNGTLRLPLKPIGLHDAAPIEEPLDPVPAYTKEATAVPIATQTTKTATVGIDPIDAKPTVTTTSATSATDGVDPIVVSKPTTKTTSSSSSSSSSSTTSQPVSSPAPGSDKGGDADNGKNPLNKVADAASDLWGWLTDKIGEAWDKIKGSTSSGESEKSG
ncbi:hypothetical protein SBRCBS47491_008314 [Sporothrix bragantina]|uniref:Uncharacterized protein n=1 Tax=Sporothrix bragantina TaxID=671064 RepID=A0ABP0CNA3_9PEZI